MMVQIIQNSFKTTTEKNNCILGCNSDKISIWGHKFTMLSNVTHLRGDGEGSVKLLQCIRGWGGGLIELNNT